MLEAVTWSETLDEWHKDPQKLLAWITKLFYDAQIPPDGATTWLARNGKIIIAPTFEDSYSYAKKESEVKE